MRKILLLGAGGKKKPEIDLPGEKYSVITLDNNPIHKPDILADLELLPYYWAQDGEYDEVHAYEILEHTGQLGDWKFFFEQFNEFHRMLKKGGYFVASVPAYNGMWAFGDPGHKRVINHGSLTFLTQSHYEKGVGKTAMSDYRFVYKADFQIELQAYDDPIFKFILRAQ